MDSRHFCMGFNRLYMYHQSFIQRMKMQKNVQKNEHKHTQMERRTWSDFF